MSSCHWIPLDSHRIVPCDQTINHQVNKVAAFYALSCAREEASIVEGYVLAASP